MKYNSENMRSILKIFVFARGTLFWLTLYLTEIRGNNDIKSDNVNNFL